MGVDRFNDFINRNSLVEISISGRKFTRISDDGVKFSKLDRYLMSDDFIKLWEDLSIIALDRRLSDHCPLMLHDKAIDYGPKPFKVFDVWDRLKNVKSDLKSWSIDAFGGLDGEINELKKKAMGWEIKAESIPLDDTERDPRLPDCSHECSPFFSQLSYSEAKVIELEFSEAEIWEAVKDCGSTKAPGPDGFDLRFYKKKLYIVQNDLVAAVNDFWVNGSISSGCNASFTTLISKTTDPVTLNEYRPIRFLGSYYKFFPTGLENLCLSLLVLRKVPSKR
ncbi:uncharacterized protein [Rutidosis leptorrhynchoides]|uniref:uncharacterized protein n=1 Tax=Rutidosis leptorrhynchoides TaxID=125765 RepID=UPI003A998820